MPVVFRYNGFHFHFFANEGNPREPVHVHVRRGRDNAKFWLWPEVALAYNLGFSPATLRELSMIIEGRRGQIERAWNDFFS
ncbi:DUF4160 domain-containing protein [Blastomonas aquatica]|uniref:DUF4160 domain-containing protein n=1 Tax=Blastomonas aquatica TaxID=1510276 RepID=A0ABQ1IQ88_9SPHN|nr:DUF4160 domain-containing protein [Blastomonas aquatica]GGB49871.1 hypothetical protein GCM10010833_00650 [Blastomonas aquatica]